VRFALPSSDEGVLCCVSEERFKCLVNSIVYGGLLTQVQLRLSPKTLEEIDRWVAEGKFKSRSDAIKTIINFYEEREKTREFFKMLTKRSEEAKKNPDALIPLEES
jgi:Arc/MetJ-type ribon-helix-helix transcriptional regulator